MGSAKEFLDTTKEFFGSAEEFLGAAKELLGTRKEYILMETIEPRKIIENKLKNHFTSIFLYFFLVFEDFGKNWKMSADPSAQRFVSSRLGRAAGSAGERFDSSK